MGLLRAVTKSNRSIQTNQGLTLPLSRQLSTQMETTNSSDPFLQNPSTGLVYGRIYGIGRHTRKSDIISMIGAYNLSLDDVRFEYNANYAPVAGEQLSMKLEWIMEDQTSRPYIRTLYWFLFIFLSLDGHIYPVSVWDTFVSI